MGMLEKLFHLSERNSDVRTELIAGATTFMTMAYIIFVNPGILAKAGVPFEAAAAATCLASGAATLLMGLWANYPIALASGMGLNAVVAFGLVLGHKMSWQSAMGLVFIEGLLVLILVVVGAREAVMEAIPADLRRAIGAGIGIFIAFIGLQNAGMVADHPATLVTFGAVARPAVFVALFGLVIMVALMRRQTPGAILIGILAATALHILLMKFVVAPITGNAALANTLLPHKVFALPDFSTIGKIDIPGALSLGLTSVALIFSLFMVDFFDTLGTVTALGEQAGFINKKLRTLPGLRRVLVTDSLGAVFGGFCGASSVTSYIESASGIGSGGRTGLTAVVVALLFFVSMFLAPLVGMVPPAATAPALVVVGFLMMRAAADINWKQLETALAAFIIVLGIPLTYSISHGIGYGFIVYSLSTLFTGNFRKTSWIVHTVSLFFLTTFIVEDFINSGCAVSNAACWLER